jgi:chromosome partitioning protein
MAGITQACSICGKSFEAQFRYQMEERVEEDASGRQRVSFSFFCSQGCLEKSHAQGDTGSATCDACATTFKVELASQVVFVNGRRHYACGTDCRAQVLAEARGARLGDGLVWGAPPSPPAAIAAEPPRAPGVAISTIPSIPAMPRGQRPPPPRPIPARPVGPTAAPSSACAAPVSAAVPARVTAGADFSAPPVVGELAAAEAAFAAGSAPEAIGPASAEEAAAVTASGHGAGPRVLAVFNHKGGTGKTTTAVTLAAGLAERGKRVLLVDTDGQGNVAVSLGAGAERSLYHVLVMGLPVKDAVVSARPGLDVLVANETLAAAELYLAGRKNRDRVLATRLEAARHSYDFVVVDCSPSLSLMNQNALVFADAVLCPVACDYLSLVGVRQVLRTIKQVNKLLGHPVQLWGVLPTMFDARARICHEALDTLREHFKDRCLEPIRAAIRVKEAPSQGKTVLEHAPGTSAADDYLKVVDRLLAECGAADAPGSRSDSSADDEAGLVARAG